MSDTKINIVQSAKDELREELLKEAKEKLKSKMKQRHLAKQTLDNIDRELADLELEIKDKINAL
jgi:flagellar motility protein MotE (MotC chaperone)